jgi:5-hydroxyisourate hydrolase-like protein (transthyretin family)
VFLSLGLLVWVSASIREKPVVDPSRIARTAESEPSDSSSSVATPELETTAPARTEIAKPAPPQVEPTPSAAPAASSVKDGVTLVARFVRPDFKELEVAHASVELRDARGAVRSVSVEHKSFARFSSLAPDVYAAHVAASELEHREETLDLSHANDAKKGHEGEIVVEKRIVLWPADWVAVLVETTDGRPFSALAVDLQYTPMHLFVGAFHARVQLEPPDARNASVAAGPSDAVNSRDATSNAVDAAREASRTGASNRSDASNAPRGDGTSSIANAPTASSATNENTDPRQPDVPPSDKDLARFHPPPEYKSWELTKSCVGSLELVHPPPMWVGLDLFGQPLGWELLAPGAHEIAFRIDRAALEVRFARVSVRVVDATSHAPVANARVTLRADLSAHRRADLTNVPSGDDGRVELANVVPGRYELSVARGDSQFQRMIQIERAEHRDLGDIALGESRALEVEVVNERGEPATAWVEIGPYERGARSGDLYPAMMRHHADQRGHGKLPMPSDRAILRAAIEDGRSNGPRNVQEVHGVRSANALLDPHALPALPLRLTLHTPVKVQVATSRSNVARIEVLDELDLVVARSVRQEKKLEAELVPGRYRARTIGADGTVGIEIAFVADGRQSEIVLD